MVTLRAKSGNTKGLKKQPSHLQPQGLQHLRKNGISFISIISFIGALPAALTYAGKPNRLIDRTTPKTRGGAFFENSRPRKEGKFIFLNRRKAPNTEGRKK